MSTREIHANITARNQQTIREALGADFDRRSLTEAEQAFIDAMEPECWRQSSTLRVCGANRRYSERFTPCCYVLPLRPPCWPS